MYVGWMMKSVRLIPFDGAPMAVSHIPETTPTFKVKGGHAAC